MSARRLTSHNSPQPGFWLKWGTIILAISLSFGAFYMLPSTVDQIAKATGVAYRQGNVVRIYAKEKGALHFLVPNNSPVHAGDTMAYIGKQEVWAFASELEAESKKLNTGTVGCEDWLIVNKKVAIFHHLISSAEMLTLPNREGNTGKIGVGDITDQLQSVALWKKTHGFEATMNGTVNWCADIQEGTIVYPGKEVGKLVLSCEGNRVLFRFQPDREGLKAERGQRAVLELKDANGVPTMNMVCEIRGRIRDVSRSMGWLVAAEISPRDSFAALPDCAVRACLRVVIEHKSVFQRFRKTLWPGIVRDKP